MLECVNDAFLKAVLEPRGSVTESVCEQRQLKVNNTDCRRPTGLTVDSVLHSRGNTELKTSAYCANADVEGYRVWIPTNKIVAEFSKKKKVNGRQASPF